MQNAPQRKALEACNQLLRSKLSHEDPIQRERAIALLAQTATQAYADTLLAVLDDPAFSGTDRSNALRGLYRLGVAIPTPTLQNLLAEASRTLRKPPSQELLTCEDVLFAATTPEQLNLCAAWCCALDKSTIQYVLRTLSWGAECAKTVWFTTLVEQWFAQVSSPPTPEDLSTAEELAAVTSIVHPMLEAHWITHANFDDYYFCECLNRIPSLQRAVFRDATLRSKAFDRLEGPTELLADKFGAVEFAHALRGTVLRYSAHFLPPVSSQDYALQLRYQRALMHLAVWEHASVVLENLLTKTTLERKVTHELFRLWLRCDRSKAREWVARLLPEDVPHPGIIQEFVRQPMEDDREFLSRLLDHPEPEYRGYALHALHRLQHSPHWIETLRCYANDGTVAGALAINLLLEMEDPRTLEQRERELFDPTDSPSRTQHRIESVLRAPSLVRKHRSFFDQLLRTYQTEVEWLSAWHAKMVFDRYLRAVGEDGLPLLLETYLRTPSNELATHARDSIREFFERTLP